MRRVRFPLPLMALVTAHLALAAEQELALSPRETQVTFTLEATAHTVHGTIPVSSGAIGLDLVTGDASGEVVLDLRGARTGNARRDRDMHERVLETERFPSAVFRARRVRGALSAAGTSEVVLTGVLLLHGREHGVEIPATVTRSGSRVRADGRLTIPYVAWGLRDPSMFVLRVGKSVEVRVQAVGDLRSPTP